MKNLQKRSFKRLFALLFFAMAALIYLGTYSTGERPSSAKNQLSELILKRFELQEKILQGIETYDKRSTEVEEWDRKLNDAIKDAGYSRDEAFAEFEKGKIDGKHKLSYAYANCKMLHLRKTSQMKLDTWLNRYLPDLLNYDIHISTIEIAIEDGKIIDPNSEEQKKIDKLLATVIVEWDSPNLKDTEISNKAWDSIRKGGQ